MALLNGGPLVRRRRRGPCNRRDHPHSLYDSLCPLTRRIRHLDRRRRRRVNEPVVDDGLVGGEQVGRRSAMMVGIAMTCGKGGNPSQLGSPEMRFDAKFNP
jgi:hypothetical protein